MLHEFITRADWYKTHIAAHKKKATKAQILECLAEEERRVKDLQVELLTERVMRGSAEHRVKLLMEFVSTFDEWVKSGASLTSQEFRILSSTRDSLTDGRE